MCNNKNCILGCHLLVNIDVTCTPIENNIIDFNHHSPTSQLFLLFLIRIKCHTKNTLYGKYNNNNNSVVTINSAVDVANIVVYRSWSSNCPILFRCSLNSLIVIVVETLLCSKCKLIGCNCCHML